jgi:hypothetical protein
MAERPYISVVVAARNDNHGGDMLRRMQAFLDSWIVQARRFGLASEIVVVEWNPPAGKRKLIEELCWPAETAPVEVRFIEVPPEIHQTVGNGQWIALHQMIAKNAGLRRARGEFAVATNPDIVFSAELMRFLALRNLERGAMYRIDRLDVERDIPDSGGVDELLRFCAANVIRAHAREGSFELTRTGVRRLEPRDIVAPECGIGFGSGWCSVESSGGEHFRWIEDEAGIAFDRPGGAAPWMLLEAEVGPSAGGPALPLDLLDGGGRLLATASLDGRFTLRVHMPPHVRTGRFRLRLRTRNLPLVPDLRHLGMRVFRLSWEQILPEARSGRPGAEAAPEETRPTGSVLPEPEWCLELLGTSPGTDWSASGDAVDPAAGQMRRSACLHTNTCGDFTLLSRDDWFAMRAYPEWPIRPIHVGSVFCYAAYHAGIREVILPEPMRLYHIDHAQARTSDGEAERSATAKSPGAGTIHYRQLVKWVNLMRRWDAPMIFTPIDWGLAKVELPETSVEARRTGAAR